ncbi:LLM class flavin-dependent oxidoreductase [Rhodococcus rhodochrous]|uniref:LLM class flavin-dependent oxidoreductase n=1 Tax=Rhodococcus rhodochrous TaxID=1829 RepID=UPI001E61B677|nr:LLM class flavin-dependent oxidoreductase [Rhodococcus rhodochrous]MCD2099270.1 LLM class flavin-dependent oxidoreductase [Rhodococcus rhodochrous]MCD2120551.1 LLM class flavin-dependent oxidoreductase [Rhodococcus rhodochrous]MCQ4136162.1 LLM class flavin-dependent oxidoreductase [Rhodococcus rhodochrous]MDJ0017416.1 LLM class flavin-dependent oxidoreductase [Rhodococcus rhodochrous]
MNAVNPVPLSVLDLSPVSEGSSVPEALRNTVDLARHVEAWGYKRYWVAEHHFVAVASSAPDVLIGAIAAATRTIRVGAAAVQLGHNTAIGVVESFGTLDALYPGRIDLGLGRSGQRRAEALAGAAPETAPRATEIRDGLIIPPPFSPAKLLSSSRLAASVGILQQPGAQSPDFAQQVEDILAFLDGTYTAPDGTDLHASPGEGADLELWVFGSSSGPSAELAGRLGLPFGANYHVSPGTTVEAVEAYRAAFRPSSILRKPYVVVSADAVVADDDATARELASTYGHWTHSIRSGHGAIPYPNPDTTPPLTDEERALVDDRIGTQFVGSPNTVAERLDTLRRVTDADELVVTSVTHGHEDRLRSYELLAREWGLARVRAA